MYYNRANGGILSEGGKITTVRGANASFSSNMWNVSKIYLFYFSKESDTGIYKFINGLK